MLTPGPRPDCSYLLPRLSCPPGSFTTPAWSELSLRSAASESGWPQAVALSASPDPRPLLFNGPGGPAELRLEYRSGDIPQGFTAADMRAFVECASPRAVERRPWCMPEADPASDPTARTVTTAITELPARAAAMPRTSTLVAPRTSASPAPPPSRSPAGCSTLTSGGVPGPATSSTGLLFYPTVAWNVLLHRVGGKRRWLDRIDDHVYLGALPLAPHLKLLHDAGVRGVVNTCAEWDGPEAEFRRLGMRHLRVPTIDSTAPSAEHVHQSIAFIRAHVARDEKVYIHCKAGRSRSGTVTLCWLVA